MSKYSESENSQANRKNYKVKDKSIFNEDDYKFDNERDNFGKFDNLQHKDIDI